MALSEFQVTGIGSAGNWLSTVERIKSELHRDREVEEDAVKRALISAIQHYKWTRFHFNENVRSMLTLPDVVEYSREDPIGSGNGWPSDLLEIDEVSVSRNLYDPDNPPQPNHIGSGLAFGHPMRRIDFERMRFFLSASNSGNRPYWYSWYQNRFYVFPPSAGGQHHILFDYLACPDFPKYQFVGGDWQYFDQSGAPIEEDYSTIWLDQAEELIRSRAKADLWANYFYDTERAQVARGQEQDALRELGVARHKRLSTGRVRGHFAGDVGYGADDLGGFY